MLRSTEKSERVLEFRSKYLESQRIPTPVVHRAAVINRLDHVTHEEVRLRPRNKIKTET